MNIKQLRQTILDRAIRGQLVSQDPTDEPTSVLLERIRAEKEQLIKDKKLKREKRDNQPIEEVPFEIPEGWVWCRLGEIAYIASGSTPKSTSFVDKGIPYLKVYNLRNQVIDFDYKAQYIKESIHNGILKRSKTEIGDLIMNIVGPPLGKLAIIPTSLPESNFNQAAVLIRPYLHKNIINKYLFYFLSEMSEINSISTKGSAGQVNISLSQAKDMKIPLPPLKEQHRIVQKIEQLFALVDIIEVNKKALEKLIEQAKSQVLSDAVAGKLTHQWQFFFSYAQLSTITYISPSYNTPYEKMLPKGWAWCKLGDIGEILTGNTPSKGERAFYGNDFPFFKPNDLDIGKVETSLDSLSVLGYKQARKVPKGSILVTCIGSIGKTGITQVEGAFNQQINAIIPFECIDNYFIYYLMLSKEIQEQLNTKASATTIAILNKSKFENTLIPLPPLAEQHRIVKKIETYFSFFDTIESNL